MNILTPYSHTTLSFHPLTSHPSPPSLYTNPDPNTLTSPFTHPTPPTPPTLHPKPKPKQNKTNRNPKEKNPLTVGATRMADIFAIPIPISLSLSLSFSLSYNLLRSPTSFRVVSFLVRYRLSIRFVSCRFPSRSFSSSVFLIFLSPV